MGVRGRGLIGSIAAAVVAAGVLATAPMSSAAAPPIAAPPASSDLVAATNAMLSFDLSAALSAGTGNDASFQTGFTNPPGGQDPLSVCRYSNSDKGVDVPDTMAVGYMARNGFVWQSVYQYPSAEAASRAWARLSTAVGRALLGELVEERLRLEGQPEAPSSNWSGRGRVGSHDDVQRQRAAHGCGPGR